MVFSGLRSSVACSFLAVIVFFALVFSSTVNANTTKANNWLLTQITPTGSVVSDNDIATDYQASSETLITLETLGVTPRSAFLPVKDFVLGSPLDNTEVLSRQIFHRVANQQAVQTPLDQILQRVLILKQRSFVQSGLGDLDHDDSTVIDTTFALQAISAAGHNSVQVSELVNYLLAQQNADGSFGDTDTDDANLYVTSQALLALQGLRLAYSLDSQIALAVQALDGLKLVSDEWGSPYKNAIALLAVIPTVTDLTNYQAAIDALTSTQQVNGAWQDDAYITALAARALYSAEFFSAPTPASSGELTATVIDSATGLPLKDITITVFPAQGNPRQLVTDDDGDFIAKELAAGDYTVEVSAASYVKRELVATVTVNETLNLGDIGLSLAGGTVRGIVTDQATSNPIANAVVTLSGNTTASTTTDANGQYSLSASLGTVTISVSAPTYDTASGSGDVVSRGTLDFSPQLYLENTTPATLSSVKGLVIDQNSNRALEDVTVSIVGQSPSVQSDASGEFTLDNIDEGTIELSLTKSGYATRQFSIIVPKATIVDLSSIGLLEQQSADKAITFGQVLDAETQQPLIDTTITLSTGETLASDADGQFVFEELDGGAYTIKLEKPGYLLAEYQFDLIAGSSSDLGQLLLRKEINLSVSSIQGVVIDQDTQQPVDGATVSIAPLNLSATTNAQGEYQITNITDVNFDVSVSATGYFAKVGRVTLAKPKNATFDVELQPATPIANSDIVINSVESDLASYPAFAEVELTAYIENLASASVDTLFAIKIINSQGQIIEERPEVSIPLGGVISDAYRNIPANEEKQFEISWFPNALPAGDYQAIVQVLDAQGSRLLAENSTIVTMETTRAISGIAQFDPPITQLASQQPVNITADIMNRGNVDLSAGTVKATVTLKNRGSSAATSNAELFFQGEIDGLVSPWESAIDSAGNSYYLNQDRKTVTRVTPAGDSQLLPIESSTFASDLDVDSNGNIYLLSSRDIEVFSSNFERTNIDLTTQISPFRIEVTNDGRIFIANTNSIHQVSKVDGSTTELIGAGLSGGFRDIVQASSGDLFLSDASQNAIFVYSQGNFSRFVGIESAHGLAIDSQDNLYVTTFESNERGRLLKVTPSGVISEIASGLSSPYDVFIEANEQSFLVTNQATHEVLSIDLSGNKTVVASSTIRNPIGIAHNSQSELHVSNSGFGDIRTLDSSLSSSEVVSTGRTGKIAFDQSGQLYIANSRDIYTVNTIGENQRIVQDVTTITDVEASSQGGVLYSTGFGSLKYSTASGDITDIHIPQLYNVRNNTLESKDGKLYTLRTRRNDNILAALVEIDPSTNASKTILLSEENARFEHLISDPSGAFFAADENGKRIVKIALDGTLEDFADLTFDPIYMVLDTANNRLIVAEDRSENLYAIDLDTREESLFATGEQDFLSIGTLELDNNGDLWGRNISSQLVKVSNNGSTVETFTSLRFNSIHFTGSDLLGINTSGELRRIALDGSDSELVTSNSSLRTVNSAFVVVGNQIHAINSAVAFTYAKFDITTGNALFETHDISSAIDIAVSTSGSVLVVNSPTGILEIQDGQLPTRLSTRRFNFIEKDVLPNQFIVSDARTVSRFDRETGNLTVLAAGFSSISGLSVAPNGQISIIESVINRLSVINSTGDIINQVNGLTSPKGLVRNSDGDILIANSLPNEVLKLQNGLLSPFTGTRPSSVNFIGVNAANQSVFGTNGSTIYQLDPNENEFSAVLVTNLSDAASVKGSIFLNGSQGFAVSNAANALVGRNSLFSFNLNDGQTEQLASGISGMTDIESFNNRLFYGSNSQRSINEVTTNGISELLISSTGLPAFTDFFIDNNGDFHVFSSFNIAKFSPFGNQQQVDYSLSGLFSNIQNLTFTNNQYLLGRIGSFDIAKARIGSSAVSSSIEIGDVLFSETLDISELSLNSDKLSFDFGDWLPPIEGDFEVTVSHSGVQNDLVNTLHVGGNAAGTLSLAKNMTFPGDRLINAQLQILGADFTSVSQIDPDAATLAASTGASGRAITADTNGNIYAASSGRIVKVTPSGEVLDFFMGTLSERGGLGADNSNNIYALSGANVLKINQVGQEEILATLPSTGSYIFVDNQDQLYASDASGIYKISSMGEVTLVVSIARTYAFSKDVFDNLYVLNTSNQVFKILPDGSISSYFTDARFEYEGANLVNDCANNLLFAPTNLEPFKQGGEEDQVIQVTGNTGEVSQIFFGPPVDSALRDIDVLHYDKFSAQLLMYSDFSQGKIFSFPITCGGIDVDVTLVANDSVDLSLANPAPTSEEVLQDGLRKFTWDLRQVPNSGETIDLKYLFKDLKVGETRPALEEAYLEFSNTFDPDNVIKVPLTIPAIVVEQPMDLSVQLDKSAYVAFENVNITQIIMNNSDADFSGSLRYEIIDSNDVVVNNFIEIAIQQSAAQLEQQLFDDWNTEQTIVGTYRLRSTLVDANGNQIAVATTTFEISDDPTLINNKGASLRTTTDRTIYHTSDTVEISDLVRNLSKNSVIDDAILKVKIVNALDVVVYEFDKPLSSLSANFSNLYTDAYIFENADEGEYRVQGSIVSAQNEVLSEDEASFTVQQNGLVALAGTVSLSQTTIVAGDSLMCTDVVTNNGGIAIDDLQIRQIIVDLEAPAIQNTIDAMVNLPSTQSVTNIRSVDTALFAKSNFACALQAYVDQQWVTLDTDYFVVSEAPTVLTANDDEMFTSRGAWGTVNVLANDEVKPSGDVDITVLTQPQNGNLINAGKGTFNFFPNIIFNGQTSFQYQLEKDGVTSDPATVYIDVSPGLSCSRVPDHSVNNSQPVFAKNWAQTKGDPYDPPRYRIDVLGTSDSSVFVKNKTPNIDYPECSLSYTVKPGKRTSVTVEYRVKDVRTNGADYTSRTKIFTINIDTSKERNATTIIVPILQLLLLDETK